MAEITIDAAKVQNIEIPAFTKYQKQVIVILAFLQFTVILDFMIMSPLGALMMPALNMTTTQFGTVVSAYAFSAGASGFLAAGFADKFDRKKILMFFYLGFIVGTFFCGIASSYYYMLAARTVTGLFGGVIGAIVLAIVADVFQVSQRGRVMGFIQTAFASSQILGLPLGMYLSTLWGWHAPFFMIVAVSALSYFIILFLLRPIDGHLKIQTDKNAFQHLIHTLFNKQYTLAFAATALMSLGGFMLMPFGSAFSINNLKLQLSELPVLYFVVGIFSIFMGPLIGKATDKYGKLKVFNMGCLVTAITVIIYTNLGPTAFWLVCLIQIVLFSAIFSRMIPSQALVSALPDPANRGAFMSVSSSLQQIAGGVASVVAGLIVVSEPTGELKHFNYIGYILLVSIAITVWMLKKINTQVENKLAGK